MNQLHVGLIVLTLAFFTCFCPGEEAQVPNEQKPASEKPPEKDPFAPSPLLRERAQTPGAAAVNAPPVHAEVLLPKELPVLEGVIVKGQEVLASLRTGSGSVVIEPRGSLIVAGVKYVFVGFAENTAFLRDSEGETYELRPGVEAQEKKRVSSSPTRAVTIQPPGPPALSGERFHEVPEP